MTRLAGAGRDGRPLEATLVRRIAEQARLFGWLVSHHPDSRRLVGDAGSPDFTLVHRTRRLIVFLEIKRDGNPRSSAQFLWHDGINDSTPDRSRVWVETISLPRDESRLDAILRG